MQNDKDLISILQEKGVGGLGNNDAVDAFLPILLLAHRISTIDQMQQDKMISLNKQLVNDLLSASAKLTSLHKYSDEDIVKLRYCACVFVDESLLKNEIFMNSFWANNTLTVRLFNENLGGEKFYGIMDKWFEDSNKNKDFLEMIYLCLILGYTGKYDTAKDKDEKIGFICESIASAISTNVNSKRNDLFDIAYLNVNKIQFKRFNSKKFYIGAAAAVVGIVLAVFLYAHYRLDSANVKNSSNISNRVENFMK
ncbi:MAG: type IVB secretion system protein IcmH/DotU [Campylobacter sp.]|nr:type IVB secretion system protein IcmH/DotU [Campylobacter sp.]